MQDRSSIRDKNPSISVRYVAGQAPREVRLFTFSEDDDSHIGPYQSPFIMTCSRAAYPELRLYLARRLGAFIARINQGTCNYTTYWNDLRYNPYNVCFQQILRGELGQPTELFIIPMKRDNRRILGPEGGVKFMSEAQAGRYKLDGGTLNLFMGWNSVKNDSLCIDVYVGGSTDNNLSTVVNSI